MRIGLRFIYCRSINFSLHLIWLGLASARLVSANLDADTFCAATWPAAVPVGPVLCACACALRNIIPIRKYSNWDSLRPANSTMELSWFEYSAFLRFTFVRNLFLFSDSQAIILSLHKIRFWHFNLYYYSYRPARSSFQPGWYPLRRFWNRIFDSFFIWSVDPDGFFYLLSNH